MTASTTESLRVGRSRVEELSTEPVPRLQKVLLVIFVVGPLIATVIAIVRLWNLWVTPLDLALLAAFYAMTGTGVTIGYHRMLTHSSFEAHPVLRFLLLAFGSMSVQGGCVRWAAIHIQHHAEADTDHDPHSPLRGLFHAHLGWMYEGFRDHPELYGSWLLKDRMAMFFNRTVILWIGLGALVPFLIGGWTGLLWGFGVRVFLVQHVTWSVNSLCHTFGTRSFPTRDRSTNNWLVGLLAIGEGWHNNHHAFPRSADHGLFWWQIDVSAYIIRGLEKVGLVKNVHRVPAEHIRQKLVS